MKYLAIDIRALGLLRICVALVILTDLCIRLTDLEAFYANTGATPLSLIFNHAWNDYYLSIHTMSGLWQVQLVLFIISFFCAIMLLIGYRTRVFTILSWFMMLSLHNRNELILQGGDDILRITLFWAVFLPWGSRYSLDHLFFPAKDHPYPTVRNWATLAYILQISYLYTGSALLKGDEWHTSFTAVYYVYSLDQLAQPLSKYMYPHFELMKVLTAIAYYFELLVPVLFFIPWKHGFFRICAFVMIAGFHVFNGSTIFIGLFFLIGIATSMAILPSSAMDALDRASKRARIWALQKLQAASTAMLIASKPGKPLMIYNPLMIILVMYVFYWNLSNVAAFPYKMGDSLKFIGMTLRIDQNWGMFAPGVFKDDGWYIYEGETLDGKRIDVLQDGRAVDYRKPKNIVAQTRNDRWRKYGEHFIMADRAPIRGYLCNYYKRIWNEKHPDQHIKSLRIIYMYEFSKPDYQYVVPEREILFECVD